MVGAIACVVIAFPKVFSSCPPLLPTGERVRGEERTFGTEYSKAPARPKLIQIQEVSLA